MEKNSLDKATAPLLKQGWQRALLYVLAVTVVVVLLQFFGDIITAPFETGNETNDESLLAFIALYAAMGLLVFLVTIFFRRVIDRQSIASLGFGWKGFSNEAGLGFFAALAILGAGTLILVFTGNLSLVSRGIDPVNIITEIGLMIIVAFVEEIIFRGYLLNNLLQSMNKWWALAISAALFAVFHNTNPGVTFLAVLNIFAGGVLIGLNYIFTKNLWYGIFFHFAWNFFQGPVLGYNVSGLKEETVIQQTLLGPEALTGGTFGFEGSLLCPLLLSLVALIFAYFFTKRYEPSLQLTYKES